MSPLNNYCCELLDIIKPYIQKQDTRFHKCTPPEEIMAD